MKWVNLFIPQYGHTEWIKRKEKNRVSQPDMKRIHLLYQTGNVHLPEYWEIVYHSREDDKIFQV